MPIAVARGAARTEANPLIPHAHGRSGGAPRSSRARPVGIEARIGDDPLRVADTLGRPVAILRMGGRVPTGEGPGDPFFYGSPHWQDIAEAGFQPEALPPGDGVDGRVSQPVTNPLEAPR